MSSPVSAAGMHGNSIERQPDRSNQAVNGPFLAYQPGGPAPGAAGQVPRYTEADNNPLPQIVFGDAVPEVFKSAPAVSPDTVRADFVNEPKPVDEPSQQSNTENAKPLPWYKKRSLKALAILGMVCVVAILAVLFGTLGALGVLGNNRNTSTASTGQTSTSSSSSAIQSSSTSTKATSSTTTPPTTTTSSSSSSPSPTIPLPPQCTDYTGYLRNISFITPASNVGWHGLGYALPDARSQEECCGICYNHTSAGCNLWLWDPTDHKTVPCTIIMGYYGANKDHWCPYGHSNSSYFMINTNGSGVFSSGPCGDGGTMYEEGSDVEMKRRRWFTWFG